jgi:hypothetical protein
VTLSLIYSGSNSLGAVNSAKQVLKLFMLDAIQRLGKPIGRLLISRNLDYYNSATVDLLTNKVVLNVHMLRSGISARRLVEKVDGWLVILV